MVVRSPEEQQAVEDCLDLYAISKETVAYCLQQGGWLTDGRLITTLFTCSDTVRAMADLVALDAHLVPRAAEFCAELCDFTAEACDGIGAGDEQLGACAEAARQSADSCRRLAAIRALPIEERGLG